MYYDYVEEFITKLVLNTANKREGLKQYQDKCRIYLDEYRPDWQKSFIEVIIKANKIDDDFYYSESDQIFANRWLRRN